MSGGGEFRVHNLAAVSDEAAFKNVVLQIKLQRLGFLVPELREQRSNVGGIHLARMNRHAARQTGDTDDFHALALDDLIWHHAFDIATAFDGEIDHELVLATVEQTLAHMQAMEAAPEMAHEEPNARRLKPKARAEILWQFTRAGAFDFSCLIPGHRQLGMSGEVIVR